MKDEIAEKAAEEIKNGVFVYLDPENSRTDIAEIYEFILPIIAEACRKARAEELERRMCCEPDGAPDANNAGFTYCDSCNDILHRIESLTPKETKD